MRRPIPLMLLLLTALGCFPRVSIPENDRRRAVSELAGERRWLRVAAYAGPFFGDRTKVLLSDQPFSELDLVETTGGRPIVPAGVERVVPPGTPFRIQLVEFPTAGTIARRIVMTPRYHPWVYLEANGDDRPYVIVLPQTVSSYDDLKAEMDRLLTADDPTSYFAGLPAPQREAILRKEPLEGMDVRALEMAWGYPEKKRIDRPAGTEEWIWPGGRRHAYLQDEKVVRWEPR